MGKDLKEITIRKLDTTSLSQLTPLQLANILMSVLDDDLLKAKFIFVPLVKVKPSLKDKFLDKIQTGIDNIMPEQPIGSTRWQIIKPSPLPLIKPGEEKIRAGEAHTVRNLLIQLLTKSTNTKEIYQKFSSSILDDRLEQFQGKRIDILKKLDKYSSPIQFLDWQNALNTNVISLNTQKLISDLQKGWKPVSKEIESFIACVASAKTPKHIRDGFESLAEQFATFHRFVKTFTGVSPEEMTEILSLIVDNPEVYKLLDVDPLKSEFFEDPLARMITEYFFLEARGKKNDVILERQKGLLRDLNYRLQYLVETEPTELAKNKEVTLCLPQIKQLGSTISSRITDSMHTALALSPKQIIDKISSLVPAEIKPKDGEEKMYATKKDCQNYLDLLIKKLTPLMTQQKSSITLYNAISEFYRDQPPIIKGNITFQRKIAELFGLDINGFFSLCFYGGMQERIQELDKIINSISLTSLVPSTTPALTTTTAATVVTDTPITTPSPSATAPITSTEVKVLTSYLTKTINPPATDKDKDNEKGMDKENREETDLILFS